MAAVAAAVARSPNRIRAAPVWLEYAADWQRAAAVPAVVAPVSAPAAAADSCTRFEPWPEYVSFAIAPARI